ncbi:hypothetical protein ACP70R_009204 [Stipagrostis hirtigluma subsp. patula]
MTSMRVVRPQGLMEWPPAPWMVHVFSSRTGRWEERAFVREGEAAGTVQDMWLDLSYGSSYVLRQGYAVYHKGNLYVHCEGNFVNRLSLSKGKYQVTKSPAKIESVYAKPYLGRSKGEVLFGLARECKLRVWILNESDGQMEWILKYQDDLARYVQHVEKCGRQTDAPWVLDDVLMAAKTPSLSQESSEGHLEDDDVSSTVTDASVETQSDSEESFESDSDDEDSSSSGADAAAETQPEQSFESDSDDDGFSSGADAVLDTQSEQSFECDSDDDDVSSTTGGAEEYYMANFDILGFHPYEGVVFLDEHWRTVAYDLNSTKIQYMGYSRPRNYYLGHSNGLYESFVYTQCMIDDLHGDDTCENTS